MSQAIRNDGIIQIRVWAEIKAMLTRAAALRGQKLTEFLMRRPSRMKR
jgi:uncharacterized protein (DUF1778 family)